MASVNISEISYLDSTPSNTKGQGQIFIDQQGTVQYFYQSSGNSSDRITLVNPSTATEGDSLQNVTSQGNSQVVISAETSYPEFAIVPTEANTSESCYVLIVQSPEKVKDSLISAENVYEFNNDDDVDFGSFPEDDSPAKARLAKRSQTASKAVMCTYCSYTTTKRYLLSRHMKTHSEERPHKCSVCERGFKTLASLQNHVNTHTGTKPHPCKYCESTFTTSGELVRHIRYRHTHEKPHQCTLCDYSSVELSKLKRHMRCHTNERPFQCPHCSYASPDAFKLKRHLRIHTGEKPYECDVCHAKFTQSNSLKSHRAIHTGLKPVFKCEICPTTCGRRTDLRMHMQKLHSAGTPVQCKLCSKTLPDRYSLKVHRKEVHDGKANFACTLCPYKSMSQRHLEAHMFIHTDEKPYQCHECEQSFRQPQLLKRHINLHHDPNFLPAPPKEKVHVCSKCDKSFRHKGNMLRHMAQHDPSTSAQLQQEALTLKLGRQKRVHSFGETQFVVEEEAYEECEEDEEFANADILNTENGPQKFIVETEKPKTTIEFSALSIEPLAKSPRIDLKKKQSQKKKKGLKEVSIHSESAQANDINNCFGFDEDIEDNDDDIEKKSSEVS